MKKRFLNENTEIVKTAKLPKLDENKLRNRISKLKENDFGLFKTINDAFFSKSNNEEVFLATLKTFLISQEGIRYSVYDDRTGTCPKIPGQFRGAPTIGIGCNLNVYGKFIPKILNKDKAILSQIINGIYKLNCSEVDKIFKFCIEDHIRNINSVYKNWTRLSIIQKIVLVSLSFNLGTSRLQNNQNFHIPLKKYIEICPNINKKSLLLSIAEGILSFNNNLVKDRRLLEASLFAIYAYQN